MKAYRWEIITPESVQNETYYNLCRLADLLHYANPLKALPALGINVAVWKDECGNIVRLVLGITGTTKEGY